MNLDWDRPAGLHVRRNGRIDLHDTEDQSRRCSGEYSRSRDSSDLDLHVRGEVMERRRQRSNPAFDRGWVRFTSPGKENRNRRTTGRRIGRIVNGAILVEGRGLSAAALVQCKDTRTGCLDRQIDRVREDPVDLNLDGRDRVSGDAEGRNQVDLCRTDEKQGSRLPVEDHARRAELGRNGAVRADERRDRRQRPETIPED